LRLPGLRRLRDELDDKEIRHAGFEVTLAPTLEDAENAVRAARPDLVVLDCRLPDGDGLLLLERWRRRGTMTEVPVIVLTASVHRQDIDAALLAGADQFVPKPCPGNVLAMPIDQVPDRRRHAVDVTFLGGAAFADRAPAALARATGATLLVVAASRRGGHHRGHLLAELAPSAPNTKDAVPTATRDATRALEAFVRDEPASWLWLHRRWRAPLERKTAIAIPAPAPAPATSGPLVVTGHPG